jgi:UDP-N-acetylglucosamine acyltransferase
VHQFARVGDLAFVAANAMVSRDVPPYCLVAGDRARLYGLNVTGLRRAGVSSEERRALRAAFRALFAGPGRRESAAALAQHELASVSRLARFVLESKRGVCRRAGGPLTPEDARD